MLSPGESYLRVGCVYWGMTAKFKVGDKVRVLRDWDEAAEGGYRYYVKDNIKDYIGNDYIVERVDIDDGGCYLETTDWWFPKCVLELVEEGTKPQMDQCSSTLKKFEVGDKVKVVRNLSGLEEYDAVIGRKFVIDRINLNYTNECYLGDIDLWFSMDELEKLDEKVDPDRFVITLERFGAGGKFISGQVDISMGEYEELWKKYVEG